MADIFNKLKINSFLFFILIVFPILFNNAFEQKSTSYDLAYINKNGIIVYSLKEKKEIKSP